MYTRTPRLLTRLVRRLLRRKGPFAAHLPGANRSAELRPLRRGPPFGARFCPGME